MINAVVGLAAIGLIIWLIKAENKKFRMTEYKYYSEKIKRPVTLAVLCDLHNYSYGDGNENLFKALEDVNPDYCISAGDMIESGRMASSPADTMIFLKKLAQKHRFIYGMGNHEMRIMTDPEHNEKVSDCYMRGLGEAPEVKPLLNENVDLLEDNIRIYGLSLEREYFKKIVLNKVTAEHISELVGEPSENMLNILIGHNPDQFKAYVQWGADLVLSGHIHGGMIATPWHRGMISPRFIPFPKYDWGEYKEGNTTMILGRGLGNHTVHIRIFNRAELMVIRLLPKVKD